MLFVIEIIISAWQLSLTFVCLFVCVCVCVRSSLPLRSPTCGPESSQSLCGEAPPLSGRAAGRLPTPAVLPAMVQGSADDARHPVEEQCLLTDGRPQGPAEEHLAEANGPRQNVSNGGWGGRGVVHMEHILSIVKGVHSSELKNAFIVCPLSWLTPVRKTMYQP